MNQSITGNTRLIGLIGSPVTHSLSPLMHNTAFKKLELDYAYLAFDVDTENLEDGVKAMKTLNASGFNVTMPIKESILPYLDELSREAKLIGAVNTVKNINGRLKGYNTDGMGYVKSLNEEGFEVGKKKFVLVGAGGAARSVAIQLAIESVREIVIFNRDRDKADEICQIIRENFHDVEVKTSELNDEFLRRELINADVFVNCTPLGMGPHEEKSVIEDPEFLREDLVVSDLVYHPIKTRLIKIAETKGCEIVTGIGMILWQGAYAFKIWTGEEMPMEAVRKAIVTGRQR